MTAWRPSPDGLPELFDGLFDSLAPAASGLVRRKMFGYPSAFLGGRLCFGLHEHRLVMRLAPDRRAELLRTGTVSAFAPAGRTMTNFAAIEDPAARDPATLRALVAEAVAHVAAMPPKPQRRARARRRA